MSYQVRQIGKLRNVDCGTFESKEEATEHATAVAEEIRGWYACDKVTGPAKSTGNYTCKMKNGTSFKVQVAKVD